MNWLKRSPTYIESEDGRFVINRAGNPARVPACAADSAARKDHRVGPLTLQQAKQACEEVA